MDTEHPDTERRDTEQLSPAAPDSRALHQPEMLADLEQVIDRIGARYIADLRLLSEEFSRFYAAQLAAKDEQIVMLSQRLAATEHARDDLERQLHELKRTSARSLASLRALSEELSRQMDSSDREAGT